MGDYFVRGEPEPVAIVGMGCRMPGGVRSPDDLWRLVLSERIANRARVPRSRFNVDAYLHPSNERPGSFNVPGGYFLDDDLEAFDPGLFGSMSRAEALCIDPQHRKLLEVVYEALESSGTPLPRIAARGRTGCFAATFTADFQHMATKEPDFRHAYTAIGVDNGMLANRISYAFDLKGPSMTVNTACSSSMYALHLACQAIASGDCDDAVVGGTNLLLTVDQQMNTARMGVLSPTNQCHTFSAEADGYGRADGVGALYLRPLSHAIRDGDPIRAVIRATAVGSSGKSKDGMTHPSVEGQVDVIRSAYRRARLSPDETAYVECHGTGTPVGDPIELEAIHNAMGASSSRSGPVLVGSVKPNVGHSEAASSMATVIKAVLVLENGIIPPTAAVNTLNPNIPWDSLNVKVVTKPAKPWEASGNAPVRRIGINAFGYGGTNAHTILESAHSCVPAGYPRHRKMGAATMPRKGPADGDEVAENVPVGKDDRAHLLLLSAHDEPTLRSMQMDYSKLHISCSEDLLDMAYTMGLRRTKLPWRSFAIARKESFEADLMVAASAQRFSPGEKAARPAFVFTGQGAQWAGMGGTLLRLYPRIVRSKLRKLDEYLSQLAPPPAWTIEEVLCQPVETSPINKAEYSQTLCTAVQIMIVDLLNHWGITPLAVVGHSSGEIGAAYAAGRISAQRAITAAYLRGKVVAHLQGNGAMLAVGIGAAEAFDRYLRSPDVPWGPGRVVVACHNSPAAATLSGDAEAIEALRLVLDKDGVFNRVLRTDGRAYHSRHMKQVAGEYEEQLRLSSMQTEAGSASERHRLPMYSTVWATEMGEDSSLSTSYWVDNLVSPVLFEEGLSLMLRNVSEINLLIEVGPHCALAGPIRQTLQALDKARDVDYLPTLKRGEHDGEQMLSLAGSVWAMNGPVDMGAVLGGMEYCVDATDGDEIVKTKSASILVDLPPYHWTYSTPCWAETRMSREQRQMAQPRHDILGRRVLGASTIEPLWRNILRQKDVPWLSHHRLGGEVMLPGAGYLALAIEAITQMNEEQESPQHIESYTVRDVAFSSATVIPDDEAGTETLFRLQPLGAKSSTTGHLWYEFSASCCSYGSWKETARGKIGLNVVGSGHPLREPLDSPEAAWTKNKHIALLDRLRELGIDLGPSFTHLDDVYTSTTHHSVRADLLVTRASGLMAAESRYLMHPTIIDSCMQPSTATLYRGDMDAMRCGTIPTHIGEATFFVPSRAHLTSPSRLRVWTPGPLGNRAFATDALLTGHDGAPLLQMAGFRHTYYGAAVPHEMRGPRSRDLYLLERWDADADYLDVDHTSSFVDALRVLVHKHPQDGRVLCLEPALIPCLLGLSTWLTVDVTAPPQEGKDDILERFGDDERVKILRDDKSAATLAEGVNTGGVEYDLVVMSSSPGSPDSPALESVLGTLTPKGRIIIKGGNLKAMDSPESIATSDVSVQVLSDDSIIVKRASSSAISDGTEVSTTNGNKEDATKSALVVYRTEAPSGSSPVLESLKAKLAVAGWSIRSQRLDDPELMVAPGERVVLMDDDDARGGLLAHFAESEMRSIIRLTESAPSIAWVTHGGLLTGDRLEYSMATGAARVIRTEKGSNFDLVTMDYDESTSAERMAALVADILDRQHRDAGPAGSARPGEKEYCVKGNVVYIPRLVPHSRANAEYVADSGITAQVRPHQSHELAPAVCGRLDQATAALSYYRRDDGGPAAPPLRPDEVEVQVAAIGMTAEDGADHSHFLSHQFAGTIVRGGDEALARFPLASRVAGFASGFDGQLATLQRASTHHIFPLYDAGEQSLRRLEEAASMPAAFATAIYGLEELARVEPGENVVVVDEMGAIGLAAVQICRIIGAPVIVVTSSEATAQLLLDNGLVNETCRVVLWSRGRDNGDGCLRRLVQEELTALGGGIDAVLCPASVDDGFVLPSIGPCLSPLARVSVVGTPATRGGDGSVLTMLPIHQSIHVSYFQLKDVARNRPRLMSRIISRCGELYRKGLLRSFDPITILEPAQALKSSVPEEMGRGVHVVSYLDDAVFEVAGPRTQSPLRLSPDASYLLVGCLGGLGRAVALRMAERGARHLIFLSRSGTASSQIAADTVETLESQGIEVVVLRADIMKLDELEQAVVEMRSSKYSLSPIRGVLNAAGVLHDGLFSNMTSAMWHEAADPKVVGSLNLHRVFSPTAPTGEQPPALDFFVMTSSVACALGSGGQSNYAAANAFLDALARKRRAQGLPAVSLILPAILDIGYIAEHSELKKSVTGKGMYGIYSPEMLEAFEVAMRPQGRDDDVVGDHLIVGVQPRRFGAAVAAAGAHAPWADDARYSWLGTAVGQQAGGEQDGAGGSRGARASQDIVAAIRRAPDRQLAVAAATEHVAARLIRLLMLDEATVDTTQRSVGSYGLDSMIGAEFRNWLFREFGADIPFQQLLAGSLTISELAGILCTKVLST